MRAGRTASAEGVFKRPHPMAAMAGGVKGSGAEARRAGRWRWLAALAILSPGFSSCVATARVSTDPIARAAGESGSEPRIVSAVQDWFALLESQPPAAFSPSDLLPEASFELTLADGKVRSRSGLRAWLFDLRTGHRQVEYRIGAIRVDSAGEGLYEAHFEFDRQAVDEAGAPHIARREHAWLVQAIPRDAPRILRIDERPLLPFPGTGPQIVCY